MSTTKKCKKKANAVVAAVSRSLPPNRWCDKLPLLVKRKERCVALDSQGNRCKKIAIIEDYYHGDTENIYTDYNEQVQWVRIAFCERHFKHHDPAAYKNLMKRFGDNGG
jgi:hypothetical protein